MDSRYQELDKNVVGSGAEALKFLPPNMRKLSTGIKEVKHMESNENPNAFKLKHWRDGIRLTKGHIDAENLKYQDLYEYFQKSREQQAPKRKESEFGEISLPSNKILLGLAGLALICVLLCKRK